MCIHRHAATCTVKRKTSKMNGTSRGICWNWQERKSGKQQRINSAGSLSLSACLSVSLSLWSLSTTLSLSFRYKLQASLSSSAARHTHTHTQSLLRFHCCCRSFFFCMPKTVSAYRPANSVLFLSFASGNSNRRHGNFILAQPTNIFAATQIMWVT